MSKMRRLMLLASAALPYGLPHATAADASAQTQTRSDSVRSWHFEVLLDNKPIGFHDFTATPTAGGTVVNSHASFNVSRFWIPFYRYEHTDRELWRDDCLREIEAVTHDNGRQSSVRGYPRDGSLELQLSAAHSSLAGCVWTYAYWDRRVISQERLLNAQTGEYQAIAVNRAGQELISVRGAMVLADHYSLRSPKFAIDLWYSPQGDWVALESHTSGGAELRYQLR